MEGMVVYCTDCTPKGLYNFDGTTWNALVNKGNATGDMQYWDGTRWIMIPVGYPLGVLQLSESNIPFWSFTIGSKGPAGGIVFYDKGAYSNGWRFLEAAPGDQISGALWGCSEMHIPGASGLAIGTGQANTTAIVNSCSTAGIAARICDDLVINGFSDWFLPSRDELNVMYKERFTINGFATSRAQLPSFPYWSSSNVQTGFATQSAYGQRFNLGEQNLYDKSDNMLLLRAIRAF